MTGGGTHWVFGYGSLMWNPGFPHAGAQPARISGFHRKLCVYSSHYRGTPEKPGLVFGLDRGGSCTGMAFEVNAPDWPGAWNYLRQREQVTMVYREVFCPVKLRDGRTVKALTYVVDRLHPQCAVGLTDQQIVALVRQGEGLSGRNTDYVRNTHAHLTALAISDPSLARIIALLEA